MATYPVNTANVINEGGLDQICNNSRNRATAANQIGVNWMLGSGATPPSTAPSSNNSTALAAANLGVGIVVLSPTTTSLTFTTDTAANIVSYMALNSAGAYIGDVLTCFLVNGSANAFTVGFGTGVTKDANVSATWPASTSKTMYFRLTNVTPGSEAVTVYF